MRQMIMEHPVYVFDNDVAIVRHK